MALGVKYRLEFGNNNPGTSNIGWRLDILQEGYTGSVQDIIGTSDPIQIQYVNNNEIYDTFIGSQATIQLIKNDDVDYDDFYRLQEADNTPNDRAYEVRLRYQVDKSGSYQEYWRGWVQNVDFEEQYTTEPYDIQITATDGINLIGERKIPFTFNTDGEAGTSRIGEYIFECLRLGPGLGLDVAVYGDIMTGGKYGVVDATADNFTMLASDYGLDKTYKEAMEATLRAFNCKVFQANGRWNVISNSAHAATISSNAENIPFKLYEYSDGSWTDNPTENTTTNALKRLTAVADGGDAAPINESIVTIQRRGLFSSEWECENQNGRALNSNPFLYEDTSGWTINSSFYNASAVTSAFDTGDRSIRTTVVPDKDTKQSRYIRNRQNLAYATLTASEWDKKTPFKLITTLRQDWTSNTIISSAMRCRLVVRTGRSTVRWAAYDWQSGRWETYFSLSDMNKVGEHYLTMEQKESGVWTIHEQDINAYSYLTGSGRYLQVEFSDPFGLDSEGDQIESDSLSITSYIDSAILEHTPGEDFEPFYETYQTNFAESHNNEQHFYTDITDQPLGKHGRGYIIETNFNRRGKTENKSLEELVTTQQLNDNRAFLKMYQGTMIGTDSEPIHLNNKLLIDVNNNAESLSCILQSLTFSPKNNTYDFLGYIPNQASDIGTYVRENVYPDNKAYLGRGENKIYQVEIDLTNIVLPSDALDTETVDDYIELNLPKALDDDENEEVGKYVFNYFYTQSGEDVNEEVVIYPTSGYEVNASNFSIRDTADDPKPDAINTDNFRDLGAATALGINFTLPDDSDAETIVIDGEVDVLSTENVNFTVTTSMNEGDTGYSISSATEQNIIGGRTEFLSVYVTPDENTKEITLANSSIAVTAYDDGDNALSNIVGTISELSYGTGIHYIIPITPTSDLDDVGIVVTATVTDLPSGVTTSTITLTSSEGGDTDDFSIVNPPAQTSVVGTVFTARYEVEADQDKYFTPGTVVVAIDDDDADTDGLQSVIDRAYVVFGSHTEYIVVVEGVTDAADASGAVTISAELQDTDPGADGVSYAELFIYQRASSAPSTPSDTTVTFSSSGASWTAPTGWSKSIPSGTGDIYVSTAAASRGGYGTDDASWSTPRVLNGEDGSDGIQQIQVNLYQRASTAPSAPSDTTFTFAATGVTYTTPSGWNTSVPSGSNPLYITSAYPSRAGYGDDTASWSTPSVFAQNGDNGADGVDGNSIAQVTIYQRATSKPTISGTAATYNFGTNVLTPPGTGWSSALPAGTNPLYAAVAQVESNPGGTGTITIPNDDWSDVELLVQNGSDGDDGSAGTSVYTANIYQRATSQPSTPTGGSYNFGTNALTAPTGWSESIPSGTNPVWVSEDTFSVVGATGTDSSTSWSTPVKFVENGATGSAGDDGKSTYLYPIFIRAATKPAKPTGGSFNFTTNVGTPPTGWSNSVPENDGNPVWETTALASITGDTGTDSTLTWADVEALSVANKYTFRINLNTTDAFNAKINKTHIDFEFTDSDLGTSDTLTDEDFTVESADANMEYTAIGDITVTAGTGVTVGTKTISSNVITQPITQITYPANAPLTGLHEVDVTISGSATTLVDSTTGSIVGVTSDRVRANTGTTTFTVTSDRAWKLQSYSSSGIVPINQPTAAFTPSSGTAGTHTITARPTVVLGSNGRLVDSDGSDDNSGATSGTINIYLVANSQTGNFDTTNLDSDSFTWTAIGGADDNIVSSLNVAEIRLVTTIPAAADQEDGVLYLK